MKLFYLLLLFALLPFSVCADDKRIDPPKREVDSAVKGMGAAAVFVYDSGVEAPPATCVPETVNVKAADGSNITTTTICEKINVATNPNKLFEVSVACSAPSPSSLSSTCVATNTTGTWLGEEWADVRISISPLLDGRPQADWSSMFCAGCSWVWNQVSSTCDSVTSSASSVNIRNDFSDDPYGTCSTSGRVNVSDPETGLSWDSELITATLSSTAPAKDFTLTVDVSAGQNIESFDSKFAAVKVRGNSTNGIMYIIPKLNGLTRDRWTTDLNCPGCSFDVSVAYPSSARTCNAPSSSIPVNTNGFGIGERSTSSSDYCQGSLVVNISESGPAPIKYSARYPNSGSQSFSIRQQEPLCSAGSGSNTRWLRRSSLTCPDGSSGPYYYDAQQTQTVSCPSMYGSPVTGSWTDTGVTRAATGVVDNCSVTPPPSVPDPIVTPPPSEPDPIVTPPPPPPPPARSFSASVSGQPGPESTGSGSSATPSAVGGATASIRLYPRIDGAGENNWSISPINCPTCSFSYTKASGNCSSSSRVSVSSPYSDYHLISHNVGSAGACTQSGYFTFSDGAGWSQRVPSSGNMTISLTPNTPICTPEADKFRWEPKTGACPSGQSGAINWEAEERATSSCPGPTYSNWVATGRIRNSVSTCTVACSPQPTRERWVAKSASCSSGTVGSHTWEQKEQSVSTCPGPVYGSYTLTATKRSEVNTCASPPPPPPPPPRVNEVKAGCFVDTPGADVFTQNACASFKRITIDNYLAGIVFSAGLDAAGDRYTNPGVGWTFSWSGVCSGTSNVCMISKSRNSAGYGWGSVSATVRVRAPDGSSKTLTISANDATKVTPGNSEEF